MAGGDTADGRARVRIKGHSASVLRFFFIGVSFMMAWVLISSELGYYSKWFGPQILLELTLAFYFPSIPVLILAGSIEKALDNRVGSVMSMAVRLNTGLAGCVVCCAIFPFVPTTHTSLLWMVVAIGVMSAVAFSTSYQLVQWFRNADVIALGMGAVGSGPLVLLLQQGLAMRPLPHRWQWITQFEITAAVMTIGLISSISLFTQYWKIMSGEEEWLDPREEHARLLAEGEGVEVGQVEASEEGVMTLMARVTDNIVLPPDPFSSLPMMLPADVFDWAAEEEEEDEIRPHRHSIGGCVDIENHYESSSHSYHHHRHHSRGLSRGSMDGNQGSGVRRARTPDPPVRGGGSRVHVSPYKPPTPTFGALPGEQQQQQPHAAVFFPHSSSSPDVLTSPFSKAQVDMGGGMPKPMSVREETLTVTRDAWQVLLAFLASVTLMYLVFPFFTYVPTSGTWGDALPQILFFSRIFADIIGRFAPRNKKLLIKSPNTLLVISAIKVVVAVLFFVYIKLPSRFHYDPLSLGMVVLLWLMGGYIYTTANIMAPTLTRPSLVGRASALLALIFQVAHFAGLVLAVLLAWILYGNLAG